ncbi:hypothetical protein F383_18802 [Gossypium arboreum]|uniref:Uncharacterized protein n=1 Tax=Gossypium arboreum TaxID=29729 RepID=A0A0B0NV75_GOSAR|nr:hypothetical protein F383_18802 [Gossypium arboreum]
MLHSHVSPGVPYNL